MGQGSQDLGKPTLLSHTHWYMMRKSWLLRTYQLNDGPLCARLHGRRRMMDHTISTTGHPTVALHGRCDHNNVCTLFHDRSFSKNAQRCHTHSHMDLAKARHRQVVRWYVRDVLVLCMNYEGAFRPVSRLLRTSATCRKPLPIMR